MDDEPYKIVIREIVDVDMDEDCNSKVLVEGNVESNKKRKVISLGDSSAAQSDSMDNVESTKKAKFDKGKGIANMSLDHSSESSSPRSDVLLDAGGVTTDHDASKDYYLTLQAYFDNMDAPPGKEITIPNTMELKRGAAAGRLVNSHTELKVLRKYEFKKFDIVVDHSDHHFSIQPSAMAQPSKNWATKIQEEWRILARGLPDTIFVRAYESRMDLLRAVVIGAEGTPYHDGLFFFDVCFPSSYPNTPPLVHYHSGGLSINPNLYSGGKVCLSLLNTWPGDPSEKWVPGNSTMLQVLVSIQALILNANPFFNEPGFDKLSGSVGGEHHSIEYNEKTLIASLKTMVYTMKRPPKNFMDLVIEHFRKRVHEILRACQACIKGVQVGRFVGGDGQDVGEDNKSCSPWFRNSVASSIKTLVASFKEIGAKEAEQYIHLSEEKITPGPPTPQSVSDISFFNLFSFQLPLSELQPELYLN